MDCLYNYKVQEPIFKEYLQEMDNQQLSSMARDYVFLCETVINRPWRIDAFKRDLIREEFSQRGKSELFQIAHEFILNSLKRQPMRVQEKPSFGQRTSLMNRSLKRVVPCDSAALKRPRQEESE